MDYAVNRNNKITSGDVFLNADSTDGDRDIINSNTFDDVHLSVYDTKSIKSVKIDLLEITNDKYKSTKYNLIDGNYFGEIELSNRSLFQFASFQSQGNQII